MTLLPASLGKRSCASCPVDEATPLQGQPCVSLGPNPARGHLSTTPVPGPIMSSAVSTAVSVSAQTSVLLENSTKHDALTPSPDSQHPVASLSLQQVPPMPSSSLCASPRRILLPPRRPSPSPSPVLTPRPVLLWPKGQPLASPSVVHPPHPASGHHTQGPVWRPCGRFSFSLGAGASVVPKLPMPRPRCPEFFISGSRQPGPELHLEPPTARSEPHGGTWQTLHTHRVQI